MKKYGKIFMNGIIDENPTFRMVLGMCPTLPLRPRRATALAWAWP